MCRETYLEELRRRLARIPRVELEEVMSYYEEYFDEAGPEREVEVMRELGTPAQLAKQVLADFAIRESVAAPKSPSKGIWAVVTVILAILASPIAIPLAFVAVVLLFVAVLLVGIFIFVGVVVAFSLGVAGIATVAGGVTSIFVHPLNSLVMTGTGAALVGVCLLLGLAIYIGIVRGLPRATEGMHRFLNRIRRKGSKR